MDLHFEKATRLNASKRTIFTQLTEPSRLAMTIPWKQNVRKMNPSKLEVEVKVDIPNGNDLLNLEVAVVETEPPTSAKLVATGRGKESSLKITSTFNLLGDQPTWIHLTADAEIAGAMASIGQGELKTMADRRVEEMMSELAQAVESPAGPQTSDPR